VFVDQRRQPRHIFLFDFEAFGPQLVERRFHIQGIPQYDRIDHQPQRPELIFLALTVPLSQFTSLAMEHRAGDTVAPLAAVELGQNASSKLSVSVGVRVATEQDY